MINPSKPKEGAQREMGQTGTPRHVGCCCPATGRAPRQADCGTSVVVTCSSPDLGGTSEGPRRHCQRIQGPGPQRSTLASISLLTHAPLLGPSGRYG